MFALLPTWCRRFPVLTNHATRILVVKILFQIKIKKCGVWNLCTTCILFHRWRRPIRRCACLFVSCQHTGHKIKTSNEESTHRQTFTATTKWLQRTSSRGNRRRTFWLLRTNLTQKISPWLLSRIRTYFKHRISLL